MPRRWTCPNAGFLTRSCFNHHEARPDDLRVVEIGGASVLVCSNTCEVLARTRIEQRTHPQESYVQSRHVAPALQEPRQSGKSRARPDPNSGRRSN